jgi:hypothetical protein
VFSEDGREIVKKDIIVKDTTIFLGFWEKINNPDFNSIEFDGIKNQAGVNSFILVGDHK